MVLGIFVGAVLSWMNSCALAADPAPSPSWNPGGVSEQGTQTFGQINNVSLITGLEEGRTGQSYVQAHALRLRLSHFDSGKRVFPNSVMDGTSSDLTFPLGTWPVRRAEDLWRNRYYSEVKIYRFAGSGLTLMPLLMAFIESAPALSGHPVVLNNIKMELKDSSTELSKWAMANVSRWSSAGQMLDEIAAMQPDFPRMGIIAKKRGLRGDSHETEIEAGIKKRLASYRPSQWGDAILGSLGVIGFFNPAAWGLALLLGALFEDSSAKYTDHYFADEMDLVVDGGQYTTVVEGPEKQVLGGFDATVTQTFGQTAAMRTINLDQLLTEVEKRARQAWKSQKKPWQVWRWFERFNPASQKYANFLVDAMASALTEAGANSAWIESRRLALQAGGCADLFQAPPSKRRASK